MRDYDAESISEISDSGALPFRCSSSHRTDHRYRRHGPRTTDGYDGDTVTRAADLPGRWCHCVRRPIATLEITKMNVCHSHRVRHVTFSRENGE